MSPERCDYRIAVNRRDACRVGRNSVVQSKTATWNIPHTRGAAACLFEPGDCLIDLRLKQMSLTYAEVPIEDLRVARTEADGPLLKWDRLVDRPVIGLASADVSQRVYEVAVERKRHLIFGNRLCIPALDTQYLPHDEMRAGASRQSSHRLPGQSLCAFDIGVG